MTTCDIVSITGYSSSGEGVARLDNGCVVFVRGAARGDICKIAIVSERPRSCRAEITEILQPSEHRIKPDCPAYPMCGGCNFRHITYEEELRAKLRRVNDAFERIGGITIRVEEIITANQINGYRNKAVLHTARQGDKTIIGFYRSGSHKVCPITRCLLLQDELNETLSRLWKEPLQGGKTLTLRAGYDDIRATAEEELDGLVFQISDTSFFQVNNRAALLLYQKAREYAALSESGILVDLYCGVGSLTLFIGRDAGAALGVEKNPAAVDDARINARRNGLKHVNFICADTAEWDAGRMRPDCVVVDPPRNGLSAGAVRSMQKMSPARIVYISCDPATLARDIGLLQDYEPVRICAADMFPRTANVECCLLLCRK